jgi:serine/threonine-protein kinase
MSSHDSLVGVLLDGRYRLDAEIGRGGMGAVFRATQVNLGRTVAVKVVKGDYSANASVITRFQREAHAVARLKHPNVVAVHDYGFAPQVGAYLVIEFLEGRSLRDEIAIRRRFGAEDAVHLLRQVLSGLQAAHSAGIVHRDIKPENIFLETSSGAVCTKILDFGIAKLREDGDTQITLTKTGVLMGTPIYMSPEQCNGMGVDARSDIYSLGCVLYEMLTGQPPFLANTFAALVHKHVYESPMAPHTRVPDLPIWIEAAAMRALAKSPGERFASANEFAAALDASAGETSLAISAAPGAYGFTAAELSLHTATSLMASSADVPNNLPGEMTPFVGREREVSAVAVRLEESRDWEDSPVVSGRGACHGLLSRRCLVRRAGISRRRRSRADGRRHSPGREGRRGRLDRRRDCQPTGKQDGVDRARQLRAPGAGVCFVRHPTASIVSKSESGCDQP